MLFNPPIRTTLKPVAPPFSASLFIARLTGVVQFPPDVLSAIMAFEGA